MYEIIEKHYFYFPWLNGSSDVLFNLIGMHPEEVNSLSLVQIVQKLFATFPVLKDRSILFFENAVANKERFVSPTDDIEHLALYPLLQIIISMLKNRVLGNALSNTFAKHCKNEFTKVGALKLFPNKILRKFCANVGIICQIGKEIIDGTLYSFEMNFDSYLKVASKLSDKKWKLINRQFKNGKVYLIRPEVVMLLREYIREKVRPDYTQIDELLFTELEQIPEMKEILLHVEHLIQENTSRFQSSLITDGEKIGSDLFSPCIQAILFRAIHGENLSHNERLAICFYYLNTNHTIEETVDIFRTSPDFDESMARYQVEFAAGIGGKGKKYSMFKCSKLKSLHLCYADHKDFGDPLCVKGAKRKNGEIIPIQNPAKDYIFWKKVELNRLHHSQIDLGEKALSSDQNQRESLISINKKRSTSKKTKGDHA